MELNIPRQQRPPLGGDRPSVAAQGNPLPQPQVLHSAASFLAATFWAIVWAIALLSCHSVESAESEPVDYGSQVKPVLKERCYACHGVLQQQGGLRLDTAAWARAGGDNGPATESQGGSPSLLWQRVTSEDPATRMPQEGPPLNDKQLAALRSWLEAGAPGPADERPQLDPQQHWAFQPISRPTVPQVVRSGWCRNPVDAFIAAQHEAHGLTPQEEAQRALLIRRLYLDLIGLPPLPAELEAAQLDASPDWYERLVDRLLDDPRYGQRWARHWMDIWRYSDWWGLGDQLRNSHPHIWHWRDWIIDSLNEDLPYDEMVRQMLAADELYPNDLQKLRATGFLARNYFLFNRNQWMDETVEHVSKGFLGLTMNCAKCHDHKFDPFQQADFYHFRAFFEPYHVRIDSVPGEPDLARNGIPRVFDGLPDLPTYVFVRGLESQPDKTTVLAPQVPQLLGGHLPPAERVALPIEAWQPARRDWVLRDQIAMAERSVSAAANAQAKSTEVATATGNSPATSVDVQLASRRLEVAEAELMSVRWRAWATQARWTRDDSQSAWGRPWPAFDHVAGWFTARAVQAERRLAAVRAELAVAELEHRLSGAADNQRAGIEGELKTAREGLNKALATAAEAVSADAQFTPLTGARWTPTRFASSLADDPTVEFHPYSTGRRTALARWITDPAHPLTARVAVNHLWNRHFGTPLVGTVFDFGLNGSPPTHPELVDWLAAELVSSGWSFKHVHRLIVTSATYRLSSSASGQEANVAMDAENRWWWRRQPLRLESQVVRDSILTLAGSLDCRLSGPPVLPAEQDQSQRRSMYFFHSNNDRNLFLTTFDEATVKECYRRDQSIVPQQALALSNSRLVAEAAEQISVLIEKTASLDDDEFARLAFLHVLGVTADDRELAACRRALQAWRENPAEAGQARAHLVRVLLNHNDFVTLR
ncbi:MAG: PSD1 and planctomycete cytochrome C domain-containing protein [Pirellulales bacterium]